MAGRKNKYETHVAPYLEDIKYWCRDGATEEEICKRLGVALSTFQNYKNDYDELVEVLRNGKQHIDYKVEDALLQRALGYRFDEVTYEYDEEVKRVTKQQAGDTTAAIFWLKNRQPEKWRDKQDVSHSGPDGGPIEIEDVSPRDIMKEKLEAMRGKSKKEDG